MNSNSVNTWGVIFRQILVMKPRAPMGANFSARSALGRSAGSFMVRKITAWFGAEPPNPPMGVYMCLTSPRVLMMASHCLTIWSVWVRE